MSQNLRADACIKIAELKELLQDLKKELTVHNFLSAEHVVSYVTNAFDDQNGNITKKIKDLEQVLRKGERNRPKKKYLKADKTPLLTIDIYYDLKARLTVNEISKKYKISVVSFYNHLKDSSLKELELKKLQKDERYSATVLSKIPHDEVF